MKTFFGFLLTIFVLTSYGQQTEKTAENIVATQLEEALQMMGLQYSGTIDEFFNQTGTKDMSLIYSNIFNTSDSLKALGDIGYMDKAIFSTAQYLDTCHWIVSPIVSMLLFENKKYNEAAFLMYVGTMRYNYLSKVGTEIEGGQAMSMVIGLYYLPLFNMYLQTDAENYLHVLNTVIYYCENNDYPSFPKSENIEKYDEVLDEFRGMVSEIETNKKELEAQWKEARVYYEEARNEEAKRDSAKKKVIVKNTSLIGKWTGPGDVYEFISDDSVYIQGRHSANVVKTKCAINYGGHPIKVEIFYTNTRTDEIYTQDFIAEFLGENKIKIGAPYSNNASKFNPEHSFILTRKLAGEKNHYDYPKTERSDIPEKSKRISKKELKRFWNNNVQAITDNETDKIIEQIRFPFSGVQDWGSEMDLAYFLDYGSHDSPVMNNEELSVGLRDLDYTAIEQIEMYNGDVILMIYMLGNPQYTIREEDKAMYRQFGLLFKNDGSQWKLCYYDIGDLIDGSSEAILAKQNFMIEQWSAKFAKESIFSKNVQAMIDLDKETIIEQTNFPLRGNWGEIIGLSGSPSDWTSDNLSDSFDVFFSPEMRLALSKKYPREMRESYDEPFTFNTYASPESTKTDEGWILYDILRLKFGYVDNKWKLIQLDYEYRTD